MKSGLINKWWIVCPVRNTKRDTWLPVKVPTFFGVPITTMLFIASGPFKTHEDACREAIYRNKKTMESKNAS